MVPLGRDGCDPRHRERGLLHTIAVTLSRPVVITLEPGPGVSIAEVKREALALAAREACDVAFCSNGTRYYVGAEAALSSITETEETA